MTAKLLHSPWPIDAVAATSSAVGHPASHITVPGVGRAWRSTSTSTQNLDIDLGTARSAPVLCLQGVNAPTVTVSYGSASYTTTNAGTQTLARDRHGRRKHSLALAGSVRFIRIVFAASGPDDGAAFYSLGAAYVMAATLALPEDPLLGSDARIRWPQTLIELPNGVDVLLGRGVPRQALTLKFRPGRGGDIEELARRARARTCWLDFGDAAHRDLQWPVRSVAGEVTRTFARVSQDETTIALTEVA
jgi:hypothetical protein